MTYLFDVNVLIALIDSRNSHHQTAHEWFVRIGQKSWATCPLTENGVLRVVGNPRFPNSPGSPKEVAQSLDSLLGQPGHLFWPDDISILDPNRFDLGRLLNSGQVTGSYLLALAVVHGGQLATFDRRLITDAVRGGASGVHLIQ
jgi:toxin-antitoxin system PIN domain toxin